ncbi:MAG: hypothetical protein R2712_12815 [Vicinamibacterales bacterium]
MFKLSAAMALAVALIAVEGLAPATALRLSLLLAVSSMLLFGGALRVGRIRVGASGLDRFCLSVTTLWATFPALILADAVVGRWDLAALLVAAALAGAVRLRRREAAALDLPRVIVPSGVYALALAYVVVSVAAPFGHFDAHSQVREFYTDGFQRFGVVHALAAHVPPANPFVAGLPLRYYWFSLAPIAALVQAGGATVFDAWKVLLTWQAFAFVVTLWWVTASVLGKVAAWAACVLAFVLPSAEILWHPHLVESFRQALGSARGVWPALAGLATIDPDHVVGVLVTYSDQLFMEDFLYIPQNAAAIGLFVIAVWLAAAGRWMAAAWVTALYAGTNTFFIIPGAAALAVTMTGSAGWRRTATTGVWFAGWVLVWAAFCRITPAPGALTAGVGLAIAAAAGWWSRHGSDPGAAGEVPVVAVRAAAVALVLTLAAAAALRPEQVLAGLLANYSPAILLGLGAVAWLAAGNGEPGHARRATLLVLCFGTAFWLAALVIVAPFWVSLPETVAEAAFRVGDLVNPFNYYHKAAKGMRLTWCLLGALALAGPLAIQRMRPSFLAVAIALLVPVASATTIIRPLTYLRDEPAREAPAAALLRSLGATLETVVLLEDFRGSRINQLAPVSTFFIPSWSDGQRSLSHAAGTWADQYVPTPLAGEVSERERLNGEVFAAADPGAAILRLRERYRIDYVLLREKRALGPAFTLLVDWPGGYLYAVRPAPR